jgi:alcohol dehydrogenase class IV
MQFEFATANRIIFGTGARHKMSEIAGRLGKRALVVTGRHPERHETLLAEISSTGMTNAVFSVAGEPTIDTKKEGADMARQSEAAVVIAIGGGSVIDAAKAIAALCSNSGDIFDYLEVIGAGRPLKIPPLPNIAVPTTAGTGSEVTRNAVLGSPGHKVKVSLRSPLMLPDVAVIDPELTYSVPAAVTATTGLDALTQVLEPFVSRFANPLTDVFCREGMLRAGRSLLRAFQHGGDKDARADMALASLFGGFALANAKLGAVHGFAGPLGGMYDAAHGAICACLLPHVMQENIRQLRKTASDQYLARYAEAARLLTGNTDARLEDGVRWASDITGTLKIPTLAQCGVSRADFPEIVEKSRRASSMRGNPVELSAEQLTNILQNAFSPGPGYSE